jgi:hypothetical protein
MSEYTTMRDCLKLDLKDAVAQRNEAIQERERWKMQAEQKWGMRRELEELLGVKDTQCDGQFAKGLAALRDLIKERDEAREAFAIATGALVQAHVRLRLARDAVFRLRKQRAIARNFGEQMERERDHWKRESLEQAKLLAMSADREERLRAKIVGWENKWRCAVEMAALAEIKLHDVNVAKQ